MQSIYKAVSDLLASLFFKKEKPKKIIQKPKDEPPEGYKALYFKCWLCTGHNKFACKPFPEEKKFTIECSWCGIDNVVTVAAPEN